MRDQDGLDACKAAYQAGIENLNRVLVTNLATAATDERKQAAIDEFRNGVQLCKDVRQICEQSFK